MPKITNNKRTATISLMIFSMVTGIALLVFSGLAWWAHTYIGDMVKKELTAQNIYFPPKDSMALKPEEFPDLQKYAGQRVDTPEKARAFANGYIARHLDKVANGKTYSEISSEAMKDPSNKVLQEQKATLFQGETLRGILLTSGFGYGLMAKIAGIVAVVSFVLGAIVLFFSSALKARLKFSR